MHIKDNIHGLLYFNNMEKNIIFSKTFQRLRNIKQLGLTYLIYPGATHTRYAHSLGTTYIATKIAKRLNLDIQLARLKALLHDIGHTAFSHTGEMAIKKYIGNHEQLGKEKIKEIMDFIDTYSYNEIIESSSNEAKVISGEIGADRMDYLIRDSKHTGTFHGIIDWKRIVAKLIDIDTIKPSALEDAESLLIARFFMFSSIIQYNPVRVVSEMLRVAIERALEDGMDWHMLLELSDDEMLRVLKDYPHAAPIINVLDRGIIFPIIGEYTYEPTLDVDEILSKYKHKDVIISYPFMKQYEFKVYVDRDKKQIHHYSYLVRSLLEEEKNRKKLLVIEIKPNI